MGKQLGPDGATLGDNPMELPTLARARTVRASGLTLRGISASLAQGQLLARSGRPYGPQSVANMLLAVGR